jgi:hypothetical protein
MPLDCTAVALKPEPAARPAQRPLGVTLTEAGADRAELEAFIAARYAEAYGAQLREFMPRLFGLRTAEGVLIAAFGLRGAQSGASSEPLFLEQYLDAPIEAVAAASAQRIVPRASIVEIGNVAGRHPGALRLLIALLARELTEQGFRYVAFTTHTGLINGFSRLRLPLWTIADARLDRLPASEWSSWGRYYEHAPKVLLGDIVAGFEQLSDQLAAPQAPPSSGGVQA